MDPEPILKHFNYKDEHEGEASARPPALNEGNWNQMERLVQSTVKDTVAENSKHLSLALHHLQVQNNLLKHENKSLKKALNVKKKHQKKSKTLDLQQHQEHYEGAVF
jgi:hypothetical protein